MHESHIVNEGFGVFVFQLLDGMCCQKREFEGLIFVGMFFYNSN